jgi:hypothetical protein
LRLNPHNTIRAHSCRKIETFNVDVFERSDDGEEVQPGDALAYILLQGVNAH